MPKNLSNFRVPFLLPPDLAFLEEDLAPRDYYCGFLVPKGSPVNYTDEDESNED